MAKARLILGCFLLVVVEVFRWLIKPAVKLAAAGGAAGEDDDEELMLVCLSGLLLFAKFCTVGLVPLLEKGRMDDCMMSLCVEIRCRMDKERASRKRIFITARTTSGMKM